MTSRPDAPPRVPPCACREGHDSACGGCCTQITGLGVRLGTRQILRGIDLHLHCGELTVIIGGNGAGKTTLLRAIIGEIPHSGRILFHRWGDETAIHPRLGYVPQRLTFDLQSPLTVEDLFALSLSRRPRWLLASARVRRDAVASLATVEAAHLIDRRMGALSGGELQRVLLGLAMTPVPEILLLDEPVSGIDLPGKTLFHHTLCELRRRHDLSIVLVSHDLALSAAHADRLVLLEETAVTEGAPAEVLAHPRVRRIFGDVPYQPVSGHPAPGLHHPGHDSQAGCHHA